LILLTFPAGRAGAVPPPSVSGSGLTSRSIDVTFTVDDPTLPDLPAPQILLTGSVVSWNEVCGASGYSVRISGNQVTGGSLGYTARDFELATLGLAVGSHNVTVVALGVSGLSLDSSASNQVTFVVATFNVTFYSQGGSAIDPITDITSGTTITPSPRIYYSRLWIFIEAFPTDSGDLARVIQQSPAPCEKLSGRRSEPFAC
jgi:hypothetical protein